ncbi:hypothetical protein KQI52_06595 [bacterium]|nr:hypothetical protein [bacterium]
MNVNVTEQSFADARSIAKAVHETMVASYSFDGTTVKPLPAIVLRDTIAAMLVEPDDLLRVQLTYPETGPDDRWYAACEALLGGGIEHKGQRYFVLGGSSSLKKGVLWCATDTVRKRLHRYFTTAQEALSYLGVFFSGCHQGIHRLEGVQGIVVDDGEFGTADGMGFINSTLLEKLGLSRSQLQVRLVSDVAGEEWMAKGTLLPLREGKIAKIPPQNHGDLDDLGDVDFILPRSMLKGKGTPPKDQPWTVWFGIRDIAKTRRYASSFSIAQWFDDHTLEAVWSVAEQRLDVIKGALSNRDNALRFLGLDRAVQSEGVQSHGQASRTQDIDPARTKTEAFLEAGVEPDHPWLQRQLVQLMRRSFVEVALGGGIELTGRMGAWADLPDGVICACDLPEGPVVLSRYPVRDPHSIQAVWNEPTALESALPGTIYLNNEDALQLDGDFDGDYYIVCTQEAVVDAVSSPSWYPDFRREDAPPKNRLADPLTALPFVAVSSLGNRIGTITYAISGALHSGKIAKVANIANNHWREAGDVDLHDECVRMQRIAKLSASLQAEVQSLKWDTKADRHLLDDKGLTIPDYIANAKTDHDLFVRHAAVVEGDFPLIRNYNRVARAWVHDLPATRNLLEFKSHIPIWKVPSTLDHVEEAKAVAVTYNRWIASILQQVKEPTMDDLAGPIGFLEAWDRSKTDDRPGWAAALWHVVHGTRADTTGSAAFHAFTEELVTLIADTAQLPVPELQSGITQCTATLQAGPDPSSASDQPQTWISGDPVTIPLVGALAAAGDNAASVRTVLQKLMSDGPVVIRTVSRVDYGTAFQHDNQFLGSIPQDHLLFGSVPAGLQFAARLAIRGRTVYLVPTTSDWLVSIQN